MKNMALKLILPNSTKKMMVRSHLSKIVPTLINNSVLTSSTSTDCIRIWNGSGQKGLRFLFLASSWNIVHDLLCGKEDYWPICSIEGLSTAVIQSVYTWSHLTLHRQSHGQSMDCLCKAQIWSLHRAICTLSWSKLCEHSYRKCVLKVLRIKFLWFTPPTRFCCHEPPPNISLKFNTYVCRQMTCGKQFLQLSAEYFCCCCSIVVAGMLWTAIILTMQKSRVHT